MENKFTYLEPSLEKQLKGHRNGITALYFSPNEQQIASSSLDNSVLLWDLRGTMRSYRFQGHDEAVMDVTFSPSGKYMASASRDKTVRLWVPTVTGSTGMFKAHSQTVRSVQFSPDGTKIVTASDDKIVKLWSTDKHKFLASFVGHTNWVRCARMSSDGSVIASCSDDKSTKLWNQDNGDCIHTYKDQKGHGLCLAWHPSGCYIAVGTSHGNVKLYDVRTHNLVQYYSIHNDAVTSLAFHPSGSYILTSSKDGKMKILDLLEGHPIFTLSGHTGPVNAVNFSAGGDTFASAGEDKLVFIWKTNFTELAGDLKENIEDNGSTIPKCTSQSSKITSTSKDTKDRNQGSKAWYQCYHTNKIPVTTFVHLDDVSQCNQSPRLNCSEEPNANSLMAEPRLFSQTAPCLRDKGSYTVVSPVQVNVPRSCVCASRATPAQLESSRLSVDCSLNSVGDMSHIPRIPPSPTTYTLPSVLDKSMGSTTMMSKGGCGEGKADNVLFGMIKLKENDVCYTSGTIEWVGRKRSFPINSGFKLINEQFDTQVKKMKKLNTTYTCEMHKDTDCNCPDVLPTVNAMVDHLNALHEAVDLVDLRLNTLEDVLSKKKEGSRCGQF
ncbi:hypothetical protein PYW08_015576 [Mythimna loreyi]|uniref:Uncharacterized protein n=1 Tax=Mythimna loreyi TaxID=667449 RepID=A0ACC2QW03_9NEOP|nr:hypothetical protein PYW08_015576 [Mythimna loreyi]